MTIGMLIEFMAGKSAVLHGLSHDGTPFQFNDDYPAVDYYGKLLRAGRINKRFLSMNSMEILFVLAGFSYYGTESMYSGTTGLQLEVDVFVGVVYYQRLRHLVSDKFQVNSNKSKETRITIVFFVLSRFEQLVQLMLSRINLSKVVVVKVVFVLVRWNVMLYLAMV